MIDIRMHIRAVPENWEHPLVTEIGDDGRPTKKYKILRNAEEYQEDVDRWDEQCSKWKSMSHVTVHDGNRVLTYEQWAGQRPHRDDYWPSDNCTHLMVYENRMSDIPVSLSYRSPEALASYMTTMSIMKGQPRSEEKAIYLEWMEKIYSSPEVRKIPDQAAIDKESLRIYERISSAVRAGATDEALARMIREEIAGRAELTEKAIDMMAKGLNDHMLLNARRKGVKEGHRVTLTDKPEDVEEGIHISRPVTSELGRLLKEQHSKRGNPFPFA